MRIGFCWLIKPKAGIRVGLGRYCSRTDMTAVGRGRSSLWALKTQYYIVCTAPCMRCVIRGMPEWLSQLSILTSSGFSLKGPHAPYHGADKDEQTPSNCPADVILDRSTRQQPANGLDDRRNRLVACNPLRPCRHRLGRNEGTGEVGEEEQGESIAAGRGSPATRPMAA